MLLTKCVKMRVFVFSETVTDLKLYADRKLSINQRNMLRLGRWRNFLFKHFNIEVSLFLKICLKLFFFSKKKKILKNLKQRVHSLDR